MSIGVASTAPTGAGKRITSNRAHPLKRHEERQSEDARRCIGISSVAPCYSYRFGLCTRCRVWTHCQVIHCRTISHRRRVARTPALPQQTLPPPYPSVLPLSISRTHTRKRQRPTHTHRRVYTMNNELASTPRGIGNDVTSDHVAPKRSRRRGKRGGKRGKRRLTTNQSTTVSDWVDPFDSFCEEFKRRHGALIATARSRVRFQYIRLQQGFNHETMSHYSPSWEHATVTLSMNDLCFMVVSYDEFKDHSVDSLCAYMVKYAPYCEKGSSHYVTGYSSEEEWEC